MSVNSSNELMFTIVCIRRKIKLVVLYCLFYDDCATLAFQHTASYLSASG